MRWTNTIVLFDSASKKVEFLDSKGAAAFAIDYDSIRAMQYPRYVAAVLVSPAFLLTRSKETLLDHHAEIRRRYSSGQSPWESSSVSPPV